SSSTVWVPCHCPSITSAFESNDSSVAPAIAWLASLPYSAIPAGSLTSSVMRMYALGIRSPWLTVDFKNGLFRAVGDRVLGRTLQLCGHITRIRDCPPVVRHLEDLGAQRQAHAVPGAAVLVDLDL